MYLENIDQTIFLNNNAPAWLTLGYFIIIIITIIIIIIIITTFILIQDKVFTESL